MTHTLTTRAITAYLSDICISPRWFSPTVGSYAVLPAINQLTPKDVGRGD